MVQRHTGCSTSYCLRKKNNETEPECRFNFPFETCEKTSLHFEHIHSKDNTSKYRVQVITKKKMITELTTTSAFNLKAGVQIVTFK